MIFGHFLLAAIGLVLWIVYVAGDSRGVAWTAFGFLVPVALLGFAMFARWLPVYRARATAGAAIELDESAGAAPAEPAERHFPVPVVLLHGLLAATTLVLVLIAAVQS